MSSVDPSVDRDPVSPWPYLQHPDYPNLQAASFIADTARVIGWVEIGAGVSIWYGAVVRGDVERICLGARSNIQDGAILHGDPGQPTILGEDVTVGHRAVIHGAHIESGCLIGIGAVVLNQVRIGAGSIVGAGAVVTRSVPEGSLVLGVPAKVVRQLSEAESLELIDHAHRYAHLARQYGQTDLPEHESLPKE